MPFQRGSATLRCVAWRRLAFETELQVAKVKLKTAKDKEIYAAFEEVRQKLSTLSSEWKLTATTERLSREGEAKLKESLGKLDGTSGRKDDPQLIQLQAETATLEKMSAKIVAALKDLSDANEFYLTGVKPKAAKP